MFRRKEKEEDPATIVRKTFEIPDDVLEKFKTIQEMCEDVFCTLGKGFAESVYEEALCVELQQRKIEYTRQETIPILYKDRFVGNIRLDILLHTWLPCVFELKAIASIHTEDKWQLIRYMIRKNVEYGALINFNQSITKGCLEVYFIVKSDDKFYTYSTETGEGQLVKDATPNKSRI